MNFKNNNPKNDFHLSVKVTQSNGPLSISQIIYQIVNHFVDHYANQNDKVQFDYPIMLDMYKMNCPNSQGGFFNAYHFWVFFDLKTQSKKS